jgi:hypothetical protein
MTSKESILPRLYLDVDGVVLANAPRFKEIGAYKNIPYAKEAARRLGGLSVEGVWLTTMIPQLPDLTENLGLTCMRRWLPRPPEFDFDEDDQDENTYHASWKYHALIRDQENSASPFIWIDDRLTPSIVTAAAERFTDRPYLIIKTDNQVGLRREHLQRVEDFCQQQQ